ncbi:DUF2238 domain-containing protein [Imhoffiella purpurea]|uniref:DUF2238 domain-containing protein n=1 Tax=Imhoffiella purpurea TaxID=1249627 RepID=UPI0012FDC02A|nr:DUF2238 domain-containing protein [Imhoffiella purpurea]
MNALLFLMMCVFVYYSRFVAYRGAANIHEFFVYALAILLAILFLWLHFRRYSFGPGLLLMVQLGILMHFAGAFVRVDDHRLYDEFLLGIRYDKYVHLVNAFVSALLVRQLFILRRISLAGINRLFVVLTVLGLGALVEIVEYLVVNTVRNNGVGGYDNNMQDLIANMFGATLFLVYLAVRERLASREARDRSFPDAAD